MFEFCVPIKVPNQKLLLKKIEQNQGKCDLIEIWLDQFSDKEIDNIVWNKLSDKAVLLVCKSRKEQGNGPVSLLKRSNILMQAKSIKPRYVDVPVEIPQALLRELKTNFSPKTQWILSYHDFSRTPSLKSLKTLVSKSIKKGADIVKVATFAKENEDNLVVFQLLAWAKQKKYPMIAHCMGTTGKISRIMAPMLGSKIVFVAENKLSASASGQMTIEEFKSIQSQLIETL